jgi:methanogen extracellular protein (TIGR04279 family)
MLHRSHAGWFATGSLIVWLAKQIQKMNLRAESVKFLLVLLIAVTLSVTGISAQEMPKMDDCYIASVVIEAAAGTVENFVFATHTNSTDEGNWILLENGNSMLLPNISFRYEGVNNVNYTRDGSAVTITINPKISNKTVCYPYKYHQVYTHGSSDNITAVFYGSTCFANKSAVAHLIKITASDMMNVLGEALAGNTAPFYDTLNESSFSSITLNETGYAELDLGRPIAGDYMIFLINQTNDGITIFSATPVLVLKYGLTVTVAPSAPQPGDFIDISVELLNATDGEDYIYCALLLHENDYRGYIALQSNDSAGINLTMNNVRLKLSTGPDRYKLMEIIENTTRNGALGLTSTDETTASLALITEDNWEVGEYVLLIGVYSHLEGIWAISLYNDGLVRRD